MDIKTILMLLFIGLLAGWIAGLIKGKKMSALVNIIVGILGSFLGQWLCHTIGVSIRTFHGKWVWLNDVIIAAIGAFIILVIVNILFKGKKR